MAPEVIIVLKLVAAAALSVPLAWHRERHTRLAGIRTYPLVAIGACAYILIGMSMLDESHPGARARILQGLLSGIGFLGGGAIIKGTDYVKGTASAAAIWIMGAVGAAVALSQWTIAISLSVFTFITFVIFGYIKPKVETVEGPEDQEN